MALPTDYAIAAGWNAADGSLVTIPTLLSAYTLPTMGAVQLTPKSGLVNPYPIRTLPLSSRERGDGTVNEEWYFAAMPMTGFRYLMSTYFGSSAGKGVPVTICTARYDTSAIWYKFNAFWSYPAQKVDYVYDSLWALDLTLRFTDLVAI